MTHRILPLALTSLIFAPSCSSQFEIATDDHRRAQERHSAQVVTEEALSMNAQPAPSQAAAAPAAPSTKMPKHDKIASTYAPPKKRAKVKIKSRGGQLGFLSTLTKPTGAGLMYEMEEDAQIGSDSAFVSGNFPSRAGIEYNKPTLTEEDRFSTFSIDVDTAAYSIARRSLLTGRRPNASLVRVEELINYFKYNYDAPYKHPFAVQFDGAQSPVDGSKYLLRVGIQSQKIPNSKRLPSNLVFLVDTSCSMTSSDKLSLVKSSIKTAVENLSESDQVAITTYAGNVSLALPATSAANKDKIFQAIDRLESSGGTAMSSGMQIAYQQAALMLKPNTNTRVIVMSDGDANIGATRHKDMLKHIKGYVSEGVRMTTVGYGDGNYKDEVMEQLANKGNGNYYYIDTPRMAERVFGRDLTQMLQDVAQDVKIQVEFNPKTVRNYRLVGYENRKIADRDFRNDTVDAGEIGAGHQVTALYEIDLEPGAAKQAELATVRIRAKKPLGSKAQEIARRVQVGQVQLPFSKSANDFRFSTAVMGGAELLRNSPHANAWNFDRILSILADSASADPDHQEFLKLMRIAKRLSPQHSDRFSQSR